MDSIGTRIAPQPDKDARRSFERNQAQRKEEGAAPAAAEKPTPAPRDLFKAMVKHETVKISYVPQDPGMLAPGAETLEKSEVRDGLVNDRIRIAEPRTFPTPTPDAEGNYIYTPDNARFDAAQCFVITNRALKMAERYLDRSLPWGFSTDLDRDQLIVHPHAGADTANAFYSSEAGSLNFFSFSDPKTNEVLRTGSSADVVAHETGHALLDAMRHSYISSLAVGPGGFHESFGDMTSMLTALQDDAVLDRLYEQTRGDLSRPNLVSRNAEMLGIAVGHMRGQAPEPETLRNAINSFKYADPHFLPYSDPKDANGRPGQECHGYSNLFTGSFYDVFNGVYKEIAKDGSKTFKQAVTEARDAAGRLLFRAVEFGPAANPDYREMALAFIKADSVDNAGKYRPVIEQVFLARKIITPADIEAFNKHEGALPAGVRLTPADATEEAAQAFLETNAKALGVPDGVELELTDVHATHKGETFLVGTFARDVDLEGPEFGSLDGSRMRTLGGITVAFDKEGKLIADYFEDVTPRDVEDIKDHLKVAVADGALGIGGADSRPWTSDGTPKLYVSQTNGGDGPVVQRSPIIWG